MAVPRTPLAAMFDFDSRRYHRFVPFNFLLSLVTPHLHDVLDKFIPGGLETGDKCIAGINDTSTLKISDKDSSLVSLTSMINLPPVSLTPVNSLLPVMLTLVINIHSQISSQIFKKFELAQMGARGTLINEKI